MRRREQLRAIPAEKFAANREMARGTGAPVDGRFKTQATVDAFANNSANYVPLLIGSNNGEGGFDGARKVAGLISSHAPSFLYQFAYVPEWRKTGAAAPRIPLKSSMSSTVGSIRVRVIRASTTPIEQSRNACIRAGSHTQRQASKPRR